MKRAVFAFLFGAVMPLLPVGASAVPVTHTVTFFQNAQSGPQLKAYEVSASSKALTAFSQLSPSFSNGTEVFSGWNTNANGTGTSYANGATFSFKQDISLFAQWAPAFVAVTFEENRSAQDRTYATETESAPTPLTLFVNLSPSFSNPGYTFAGWNTLATGKGTSYSDGQSYAFVKPLVLYAQWRKTPSSQTALTLIGVLHQASFTQLGVIASTLVSDRLHQVEVVQVGATAPSGALVASHLTQLLLTRHAEAVSVVFRGYARSDGPSMTEVFATESMPSSR